jgi:glycosyltransferase involved in cell wall biosynthesis
LTPTRSKPDAGAARSNAEAVSAERWRRQPKALIVAYRFPPQGGGGVQRTLKFVKYLPQFGWLPVVHTVQNPYWPLRDDTLLSEVPPEVPVYRTLTVEFERLQGATGSLLAATERAQGNGPHGGKLSPRRRSVLVRLGKAVADVIHRRLLIPDPQMAWILPAAIKSLYIMRKTGVSLMYTSSPPNSVQVLGLLLKRVANLPWVADFRDPWTEGVRRQQAYQRNKPRQQIEEALERSVIARADHVVVTTDPALQQFVGKYPRIPEEKFSVITNGFDPADFSHTAADTALLNPREFNITLTGNVEAMFDAMPFFHAVQELVDADEEMRSCLRVNFVGTKRGKYDVFIGQSGLDRHIRYIGYVPHATSLQYLMESDVLFLCQIPVYESAGTKLSGKLFEYLHMRKPILALTLPGLTAEILSRSGLGIVVSPHDRSGIKGALQHLYRQHKVNHLSAVADNAYIQRFDRVDQSRCLSQIFDQLVRRQGQFQSSHHGEKR